MKRCECCGKEKPSNEFEYDDKICEPCVENLLLGGQSPSIDWSQFDFDKGDWK